MTPIRIVYFYQYFGTSKGGWSTRVYEMTKRWVQMGHEVTVVTTPYDKSDIPKGKGLSYEVDIEGIRVIVLNFPQSNKKTPLQRMLGFGKYIITAVYYALTLKYDVAVCSSGPITVGYMGLAAKRFRGKKFVFEVRDLWPAGAIQLGVLKKPAMIRWARWFEKRCYLNADLVVAASEGMKKDITDRYPLPNIMVVPNASDNDLFGAATPVNLPPELQGKELFMYTGSLGRIDHCIELMWAAHKVDMQRFPNFHLLIIGDGVDRAEMEAYQQAHGLTNVTFKGLIPKVELAGWLRHAKASILTIRDIPMLHTASPNKIFDAFAAGVPIIQTTQGWIREVVAKEKCGLTVPPNDPDRMAAAFEFYMTHPAEVSLHGKQAKRLAETLFSRDNCANEMIAAIDKLVHAQAAAAK